MNPEIYHEKTVPLDRVCAVLSAGGMLLYPTDTLYALGVDPERPEAVRKLFGAKNRDENRRVSYCFSSMRQAERYVHMTGVAKKLEKYLPGKLTVILEGKNGRGTVGIRVPENAFCRALADMYGPVTATSANKSGEKDLETVTEILESVSGIAAAVDGGRLTGPGSTVVDARGKKPVILRPGPVVLN